MLNKAFIIGRFVADHDVKATDKGTTVLNNTIAFDEFLNGERKANFIRVQGYGRVAEHLGKYTKKGDLIQLEGFLRDVQYVNKDGKRISYIAFIITNSTFMQSKKADDVIVDVPSEDLPF